MGSWSLTHPATLPIWVRFKVVTLLLSNLDRYVETNESISSAAVSASEMRVARPSGSIEAIGDPMSWFIEQMLRNRRWADRPGRAVNFSLWRPTRPEHGWR